MKFFQDFIVENGAAAAFPCWKELRYEQVNKGCDVIRFLDYGDKMYISVRGEIEVVIALPSKIKCEKGTEANWIKENFGNFVTYDKSQWPISPEWAFKNIDKVMKQESTSDSLVEYSVMKMISVRKLPEGTGFGEIALVSNKPRGATI